MSEANGARTVVGDWYPGEIPANVVLDEGAYVETSESFRLFGSRVGAALRLGQGSAVYTGSMFDLGPTARVRVGRYVMLNAAWIIADGEVEIGDYTLLSWQVVLMDAYRAPADPAERRRLLRASPPGAGGLPRLGAAPPARAVRIGRAVWIGFESVVLPGVTIGDGSIVGARSVVVEDVPPFAVVAGNPARLIRRLDPVDIDAVERRMEATPEVERKVSSATLPGSVF